MEKRRVVDKSFLRILAGPETGESMAGQLIEQSRQAEAEEELRQLSKALHDLCQPLTTLQCRLEMAGVLGTDAAYREAVELGLAECARLAQAVESMRGVVRAAALKAEVAAV